MNLQDVLRISEVGGKVTVKNAMNPILWLCAIIGLPSLGSLILQENPHALIEYAFIGCVAIGLGSYIFLLFFDRDKLQSEEYQIKKQELEIAQEKGQPVPTKVTDVEYTELPNQELLNEEDYNQTK